MKKIFALIICFLYFISTNVCYAFNELYYLKNTTEEKINTHFKTILLDKKYSILKEDPIYALSNKNPNDYVLMMLEPCGNNLLYYFEAGENKKLNKKILKNLDTENIFYEKSYNEVTLNRFAEIAQRTLSGETNTYSFEEPQPQKTVSQVQTQIQEPKSPTTLTGFVGKVGKGVSLPVYLQDPINTATAYVGDAVIGVLQQDWRLNNNHVIAEQGSVLYGSLTKANPAKYGSRNGSVQINFYKLETPSGKSYDIKTQKIDFEVTNDGKLKRTATRVVGAAVAGALVGLLFALAGAGDHNYGSAAAIGAGVSGGVALATQVAQQGIDAEIPSYTELDVVLESDINVVIY